MLSVVDLLGLRDGGLIAHLELLGGITFPNGWTYGNAASTALIVYLSSDGIVQAVYAFEGAHNVTALGEDVAGNSVWSAICHSCSVRTLHFGEVVVLDTTEERPAVVVRIKPGSVVRSMALSHAPEAMDSLDRTYAVIRRFEEGPVVFGTGGSTLALEESPVRSTIDIVEFSNGGVPRFMNQVRSTPLEQLPWDLFVRGGPLVVSSDHQVVLPLIVSSSTLTATYSSSPVIADSNTLLLGIHREQRMHFRSIVRTFDDPEHFASMGFAHVSLLNDTILVAGDFAGQDVVFGSGAGAVPYQSSQFWGLPGSGNVGAGLEGYVAKLQGEQVVWLRTLRPLGHPMPWEFAGSSLRSMKRVDDRWMVSGTLAGLGAWMGGAAPSSVVAPAVGGSAHSVLGSFGDDGRLLWSASTDSSAVVTAAGPYVYLAGQVTRGTNGVGPTRLHDADLEVPTPRVYLQRFDSAGGLSCGVGP